MNKIIYVVMGTTGEYSDREEWPVCAFYDEEKAKERVLLADRRADELIVTGECLEGKSINEYDKDHGAGCEDYTYFYIAVEIEE